MSRSERVDTTDACGLSRRWLLDPTLAQMLVDLNEMAERAYGAERFSWPGLYIISGHRTRNEQEAVNPFSRQSYHRCCPALAVDLRVGDIPASSTPFSVWEELGLMWNSLGGKWGGDLGAQGGEITAVTPDVNHFYLSQLGGACLV